MQPVKSLPKVNLYPFLLIALKTSITIRYKINNSNDFECYCPKHTTLALFKANLLKQPTFSRSSSDSLRTESQIQRHFDVETVRFAKVFINAGCQVLSLFIPERIDRLF